MSEVSVHGTPDIELVCFMRPRKGPGYIKWNHAGIVSTHVREWMSGATLCSRDSQTEHKKVDQHGLMIACDQPCAPGSGAPRRHQLLLVTRLGYTLLFSDTSASFSGGNTTTKTTICND